MPEICLFGGIRITMYYDDHNPPHFHAEYAGYKSLVDIQRGCVIRGALPDRQLVCPGLVRNASGRTDAKLGVGQSCPAPPENCPAHVKGVYYGAASRCRAGHTWG